MRREISAFGTGGNRARKRICTSEGGLPTERGSPFAGRIPVRAAERGCLSLPLIGGQGGFPLKIKL